MARPLAIIVRDPSQTSLVRHATTYQAASFVKGLSKEAEAAYQKEKLAPEPEEVSTVSSIHPVNSEVKSDAVEQDVDMTASIRSDFVCSPQTNNRVCH